MNPKLSTLILISVILISVVSAIMLIPANDQAKEHAKAPEKSPEKSPVISENGAGEWELEGKDFTNHARPDKLQSFFKTSSNISLIYTSFSTLSTQ